MNRRAKLRGLEKRIARNGTTIEKGETSMGTNVTYNIRVAPDFLRHLKLCAEYEATLPVEGTCVRSVNLIGGELSEHEIEYLDRGISGLECETVKSNRNLNKLPPRIGSSAGWATFALGTAAMYAFSPLCEWSTDLANYMNNQSEYLAPLTGIVQAAISLGGSATMGVLGGVLVGEGARWATNLFVDQARISNLTRKTFYTLAREKLSSEWPKS